MRADVVALSARVAGRSVWGVRRELFVVAAGLGGWAFVTLAVARVGAPHIIWPLSIGLALLSLCGWGWLRTLVTIGLYALTAPVNDRG